MTLIILTLITLSLYKLSIMNDKTDQQKHKDYLKELKKLYTIKRAK